MRSILAGLRSLVLPWGSNTNQARIVLGPDVPADLAAYYATASFTVISAILFYNRLGGYIYIALVQNSPSPSIAIGSSSGGTVRERQFITDSVFDCGDLTWEDPTTGNDILGGWSPVTLAAGWTTYGLGQAALGIMRVPSPRRSALLYGRVTVPAGAAAGVVVGTMPNVAFYPTKAVQFSADSWGGSTVVPASLETDGTLKLWGTFSGNVSFCATIPLDGGV